MKITDLEVLRMDAPSEQDNNWLFVRIHTDEGITGSAPLRQRPVRHWHPLRPRAWCRRDQRSGRTLRPRAYRFWDAVGTGARIRSPQPDSSFQALGEIPFQ